MIREHLEPDSGTVDLWAAEIDRFVYRITTDDEDDLMPPPEAKMELTARERDILTRWVEQGAEYREHWAWIRPQKQPLPEVSDPAWPRNATNRLPT